MVVWLCELGDSYNRTCGSSYDRTFGLGVTESGQILERQESLSDGYSSVSLVFATLLCIPIQFITTDKAKASRGGGKVSVL